MSNYFDHLFLLGRIAHTTAAYCYRVSSVVCRSVCFSTEPCKYGCTRQDVVWVDDWGRPKQPCVRWGSRSPVKGTILRRSRHSRRHCGVNCEKMTEPIDLPFGLWIRLGGSKHKFNRIRQVAPMCPHGRAHDATWRIRLNRPSVAAMRSRVLFTLPTCYY